MGARLPDSRPITILVAALGGEGAGVLGEWLYETAVSSGHRAQGTSIPGVAQRTGATTYYLEIHAEPDATPNCRRPVFSLNPVPGAIDLLVSSELLETARQLGLGFASRDRTTVVTSSTRALTVIEKMALGDGRLDDERLLAVLREHARTLDVLDLPALAREAGTAISAVLLGAIAASGVLPFARAAYEDTIRRSGKGVEASLRGFAAAFDALTAHREAAAALATAKRRSGAPPSDAASLASASTLAIPEPIARRFPQAVHDVVALGHARLVEYQDESYAAQYLERLDGIREAERHGDPADSLLAETTRETARWLALWMAFDDIVRVAQLKLRASRMARVRREVGAADDEIVRVYDHFKPGVPEFAALLPASLAARLLAWDDRRRRRGLPAWSVPLKLSTHAPVGALALRLLASLKGWRRRGHRHALEQQLIGRWLAAVERAAREDPALGLELARCGRLIKGYGSTNERGKRNLLHLIDHLARADAPAAARADIVRQAREAALADEGGRAFDGTLVANGLPARPVTEQPIRFVRRRGSTTDPPHVPSAGTTTTRPAASVPHRAP